MTPNTLRSASRDLQPSLDARRSSHGGMAFLLGHHTAQPQDGAQRPAAVLPMRPSQMGSEPEDAFLTGSTRSLFRRVMGLNVRPADASALPKRKAAAAAVRMDEQEKVA